MSAVLVEGPVGGGAQVPGQVEIVIELALARHAPPARHAVRVEGRGVALAPAPAEEMFIIKVCACRVMRDDGAKF